jgi:hypothetical protein
MNSQARLDQVGMPIRLNVHVASRRLVRNW